MSRLSREDAGNLVYELLTRSDPTLVEACEELAITAAQFRYGLSYIKDILAEFNTSPVVYDPATHRYSLALTEEETQGYERLRLKVAATQLRRLLTGTAIPAAAKFGSPSSRMLVRHVEGAVAEIDIMVSSLA